MPQRTEQHDAPLVLEVERFEHVAAGAERVLLRIDGRYGDRPGKRVLEAMLFVDDGLAVHRHAPIGDDGAAADSWLWRAAFDVPAAYLTDERTRFALESRPGCLVDVGHPNALTDAASVPITARAAHLARRYAAAIAVLLAVAVTPGGMPASARTEVLRVHNADGSVVYMTRDGQTLAQIPADAVIVDQGPAPQPAPQPTPQSAAPAAPQQQQQPQTSAPAAGGSSTKPSGGGLSRLADGARAQGGASTTPRKPRKVRVHHHAAPAKHAAPRPSASSGSTLHADVSAPATPQRHPHPAAPAKPHRHHPLQTAAPTAPQPAVPQAGRVPNAALHSMPVLLASPGSDDAQLKTLARVDGTARGLHGGRPAADLALPTQDLQSLGALGADGSAPAPTTPGPTAPVAPPATDGSPSVSGGVPTSTDGNRQHPSPSGRHAQPGGKHPTKTPASGARPTPAVPAAPLRHPDGTPTPADPTFFDALPGPAQPGAVPNFVIEKFRVPPFLLPIYQAAGIQYGIRWEVLAAINEIETDYGRNLNVSSAGAVGWMQFMPATWKMYGVDANRDGRRDPNNPVDAIFAAARYLKAAGGDKDIRQAVFSYNHAGWYVDSVMLRARLIAGYPADLVGSLTGLTEGRFPVAARARYADDPREAGAADSAKANRGIDIFSHAGAPAVAVNDAVVKQIGRSAAKGRYIVLQDVYGNQYTYSNLGSVAQLYPVPKQDGQSQSKANVKPLGARDPKPSAPASVGSQHTPAAAMGPARPAAPRRGAAHPSHRAVPAAAPIAAIKKRLFAHPQRPGAQRHGGFDQLLEMQATKGTETYDSYFAHPLGLNSRNATLRRLKVGAHVVGSTVLGRIGARPAGASKAPHLHFEIRPAGRGAPKIDPKPILDGWKLLESTAIYRAKGRNALYGESNFSIGEAMLLPKSLLAKRVLSDTRIDIYPAGRRDISTGQIDRRVLVVLEYLAESGLNPTVSCLRSGHSLLTTSGNVSEHSSGNAVDISAVNGIPITGHQDRGGIAEQTVRRLMALQGTVQPHQIISLLALGGNTMALPDHYNHIHVGFHPLFGDNSKLGREAMSVLRPGQWDNLVQRLGQIDNPTVPTKPSRWAIPDAKGDR